MCIDPADLPSMPSMPCLLHGWRLAGRRVVDVPPTAYSMWLLCAVLLCL